MKKYKRILMALTFLLLLSACAPSTPEPIVPIETVFAATMNAINAQTAAAMPATSTPTPTPINTRRPTITPQPSSTAVVLTPTFTPTITPVYTPTNITSGSGNVLYACELVELSPRSGHEVKPNEKFRWVWKVRNIGTKKWWTDTMFVTYVSGSKFYVKKEYALGDPTDIGEIGVFSIKMQAPKEPGTYTTTWSLKKGIHSFCYAQLKIVVKK